MMERNARRWAWLAFLTLLGCATPANVSIGRLITDAENNRFKALDEHEGKAYFVAGFVQHLGLQRGTQLVAERTGYSVGPRIAHPTAAPGVPATYRPVTHSYPQEQIQLRTERTERPYALLTQKRGAQDELLLCYFDEDDRSELGELAIGQRITMWGYFQYYERGQSGRPVPVLTSCQIER